jgi:hypothetical protein
MLGSRGRGGLERLVFDGCAHAQGAVSAAPVVEDLKVFEEALASSIRVFSGAG